MSDAGGRGGVSDAKRQSSPRALAEHVRAAAEAWRGGDELAVRAELRALAAEAGTLARAVPLPPLDSRLAARQRIAGERERSKWGA